MSYPDYRFKRLRCFSKCESGSVTVEFAIIFPAFIFLLLAAFAATQYIWTISEVQQFSSDLARQSLRFLVSDLEGAELCVALQHSAFERVSAELIFFDPQHIQSVSCTYIEDPAGLHVSVSYATNHLFFSGFLDAVGLDTEQTTQDAVFLL
ncbi:TadE-like protein [Roseivivax sp. THAF40]|uniref:TadE/TadG family type IV pilus assembly protein n=1 Tax=unclassified Roseivivax TaxID=2639302 RepID=UPI001267A96D|nr:MULTISPECIES: TadE family protein [unclassified Roseivivax]QFS82454.1 TadE-like protein [Roseivivax sp. THAF197b]QFT46223.1 TadE-like protein [Roseivivax sp. THAF40]